MARAVDETRKTLMAVSTFYDTMILKEKTVTEDDKSKQSLPSKYMYYNSLYN